MKFTKSLIASAVILASSSAAFAATDSTNIIINVTKDAYVNLIGTAVGSTNSFTTGDIDNATVSLGTLGLESNSAGNCDMTIATANNFELQNVGSGNSLGVYTINYAGAHTAGSGGTVTQSCNTAASTFDLASPALPATVDAGVYTDTVTVTVVTQ